MISQIMHATKCDIRHSHQCSNFKWNKDNKILRTNENPLTWSLVFTTHSGLVAMAVAAPAPAAAIIFFPTESWLLPSPTIQWYRMSTVVKLTNSTVYKHRFIKKTTIKMTNHVFGEDLLIAHKLRSIPTYKMSTPVTW